MCSLANFLVWLANAYTIVLLIYAVLSWIPGGVHEFTPRELRFGTLERLLARLVEPVLAPIRRVIPPIGGLDVAFLVLILILQFVVVRLLGRWALTVCFSYA